MSKSTAVFNRETSDYSLCNVDTYLGGPYFYSVFSMATISLLAFLVLCHVVHAQSAEDENGFSNPNCPKSFQCGKLDNLSFPFTVSTQPHCGPFSVSGCHEAVQMIQLKLGSSFFQVESISQTGTIVINDSTLQGNLDSESCQYFEHFDFLLDNPFKVFHYRHHNLTIFRCNRSPPAPPSQSFLPVKCSSADDNNLYYTDRDDVSLSLSPPPRCSAIQIPVNSTPHKGGSDLFSLLSAKFSLEVQIDSTCVQCLNKGGTCLTGSSDCLQSKPEGIISTCSYDRTCVVKSKSRWQLILGFLAAVAVLIIISVFFVLRKCAQTNPRMFWKRKKDNFKNIEVFLVELGSLCPKRFSFSDIKKITNSFKDKLGEGGFGGVYRGKLQDGHPVAVKVLKGSKGNAEDFINEVSSISRTSHVNVVTLLGFCFEGRKRALVYEFMPNGSLEKFIYEKSPLTSDRQLKWETLYKIAVGIARGLEYLHRGCNTRILHFDIKPHNILLDEDFCPKICDFGLAKICPRKESIVSMLGARGTPGYIAPEVFSRNFGGVSHKSDVYSYGMMVLEMVGGRRNIDCEADRTSEIYFPHWIYKRIELHQELGLHGIADDEEKEEARKMIIVSMWCIQTDPSNRPPMSRVVEMLEGRIDSLQIPPQPFLSSPSRSPPSDSPVITGSCSSVT